MINTQFSFFFIAGALLVFAGCMNQKYFILEQAIYVSSKDSPSTNSVTFPSEEIIEYFSDTVVNYILRAPIVNAYLLDSEKFQFSQGKLTIQDEFIESKAVLSPENMVWRLKESVLSSGSYTFDTIEKSCVFLPAVAFEFVSEVPNKNVFLFMDFTCKVGLVCADDGQKRINFDLMIAQLKYILYQNFKDNFTFIENLN